MDNEWIEDMSERIHKVYCQYYIDVKGEEYWTKGDYSKLNEDTKDFDRESVKVCLKEVKLRLLKNRRSVVDIEKILENRILYYYQPIQAKGEIQPSLIEMRLSDYQIKKKQIKKLAEAIYKEQSRRLGI